MGRGNILLLIVFAVVVVVLPFMVKFDPYILGVINFAGINSLVCIGLSLLLGYAGQISIGQAGFFAIGAYASGVLTVQFGCGFWVGVPAGIGLNCLVAYLAGIPTLKLKGHYLAMATLGIGEIIYIFLVADTEDFTKLIAFLGVKLGWSADTMTKTLEPYRSLTGGPSGFGQIPTFGSIHIGPWELPQSGVWFYVIWSLVFLAMALALNLIHSRIGRALRAIHGNEEAALAMGVDTAPLKIRVFVLSAILASVAGSLYAHNVTFISPGTFSINESIKFLVMVAVGGMTNVWGALVGTLIMTILPETLRMFHEIRCALLWADFVIIMMFMPNGIVGLIQRLVSKPDTEAKG